MWNGVGSEVAEPGVWPAVAYDYNIPERVIDAGDEAIWVIEAMEAAKEEA